MCVRQTKMLKDHTWDLNKSLRWDSKTSAENRQFLLIKQHFADEYSHIVWFSTWNVAIYSYDERYIECIAICWNATKMQNTSKLARLGDHKFGFPSRYAQHSKIVSIYLWENIVGGKLARWSEEETIVTLRWRWVQNNVSYPKLGITSLPSPIFFSPNNILRAFGINFIRDNRKTNWIGNYD